MYKEISLIPEEAFELFCQLLANDLEDGFPSAVELPIAEAQRDGTHFFVEDTDARKFMDQFSTSGEKSSYNLFVSSCLPASVRIDDIQSDPYLGMFFGRLIHAEGSEEQDIALYFRNKGLSLEEVDSLIRIAKAAWQLTTSQNPTEEEYGRFMKSVLLAVSQGSVNEVATAFENLKNKNAPGFELIPQRPGLFYERPLRMMDLTCHIFSIVATNDYEKLLAANYSKEQLSKMPQFMLGPLSAKSSIIDGKVVSVYDDSGTTERQGVASYDVSVNALFYSRKIFESDFFKPQPERGTIPATVVLHETVHIWQDKEKMSEALKLKEAEAHFADTFYDRLKNGKDGYAELQKKERDAYLAGWKSLQERMKESAGLTLTDDELLDILDNRSAYTPVIEDMLIRLQEGKGLPDIDMKKFGERYAESESLLIWVGAAFNTITSPGSRFRMIQGDGPLPPLDIMGISEKSDGTLAFNFVGIHLPKDEELFRKTAFSAIDAMKKTTDYPRIKANNAIQAVALYLIYMHKRHPGKVDAKKVFEKVLMPFANRLSDGIPPPFTLGI